MFGFVDSSLISQPGAASASIDERAIALANRIHSTAKGVLLEHSLHSPKPPPENPSAPVSSHKHLFILK